MLMLAGCVQPGMSPNINAATARVLDRLGIATLEADGAGCCGAVRMHLDEHEGARADARRNIDAWWPHIEQGAETVIITASGCGAHVREYGYLLQHDARYAAKAARISLLTRDIAEAVGMRAGSPFPVTSSTREAPRDPTKLARTDKADKADPAADKPGLLRRNRRCRGLHSGPRLDLDEDHGLAAPGNQVDLAALAAIAPGQDAVAFRHQESRCQPLGGMAGAAGALLRFRACHGWRVSSSARA